MVLLVVAVMLEVLVLVLADWLLEGTLVLSCPAATSTSPSPSTLTIVRGTSNCTDGEDQHKKQRSTMIHVGEEVC